MRLTQLGEAAYLAYGSVTGTCQHDWSQLPPDLQLAWCAAADAARASCQTQDLHIHNHCGVATPGLDEVPAQLTRMEQQMATIAEQLDAANLAVANLGDQLTDTQGDLAALLAIVEANRSKFSPDDQSKMDALMQNIADRQAQAAATDETVGENDGLPVPDPGAQG